MKNPRVSTPLAICALLATIANAQTTSFTATGQVNGVPTPGVMATNAAGQVLSRGLVHTWAIQSSDPRLTGQVLNIGDADFNADGSANCVGSGYVQVGAWVGTNFTPAAGVWQVAWRGLALSDNSLQLSFTGYGVGGAIEGLRLEGTATRTNAAALIDPKVPYALTGTIKPPPLNTTNVLDDFAGNQFTWPYHGAGLGTFTGIQANQQLTIRGYWPSIQTQNPADTSAYAWPGHAWAVPNGQTLEVRVDLVSLNAAATSAMLGLYHADGQGYGFAKASGWIGIWKQQQPSVTFFSAEKVATPNTNLVLSLALTPVDQNVVLTAKVLDKSNGGAVLYQRSIVDTPASDSSLTAADLAQIIGGEVWQGIVADSAGAPWTSGTSADGPVLFVTQDSYGTNAPAEATFGHLELGTYEVPPVSIERAVRLSWPAPGGVNYNLEDAPTLNGPWLPVQDQMLPGVQTLTVPLTRPMQVFRLIPAP